ncbi:hypothetical protein [Methanobrevibacter sp.]|uniref:hypothetical protein n=1 Tax=Methanobrevibacter sp. TaxID=66852 RepID=UPI0038642AAB
MITLTDDVFSIVDLTIGKTVGESIRRCTVVPSIWLSMSLLMLKLNVVGCG